jgi:hypothetical protein
MMREDTKKGRINPSNSRQATMKLFSQKALWFDIPLHRYFLNHLNPKVHLLAVLENL